MPNIESTGILSSTMIDNIGGWLQHNLIVFIAVILLPIKFTIVRLCRDQEAESVAVLAVPEDLCYVSLGLIAGDMINGAGAFHRHYAPSTHASIDLVIVVGLNLFVAVFVHRLSQICTAQFKLWRAAQKAMNADKDSKQGELALPNESDNLQLLMNRHFLLFCIGYAFQFTAVLLWLNWVAKIIAEP
ncbi:MAG: hypothetical protein ABI197_07780 [Granulicella sp.]